METVSACFYKENAEKCEEIQVIHDGRIEHITQASYKADVAGNEEAAASTELHIPLPLHLSMRILALLPVACIARLRLVCKAWNSLISSSSFQQNLQLECELAKRRSGSREWWFVMAAEAGSARPFSHDFIAFSHPSWRSFHLPLHSSAKLEGLLLRMAFSQSLVPSVVNMLVASDGGLICAVAKSGPQLTERASDCAMPTNHMNTALISELNYDVVVFNCITGELKTLPRPERLANRLISSCLITMTEEEATGMYRIILSDYKYRDMEIYEAQSGRWNVGRGISRSRAAAEEEDQQLPNHTTTITSFTDVLQADVMRYHKDKLALYKIELDTWKKTELELPRVQAGTQLLRSTVVRCAGGAILLVACLMKHSVCMEGFGVWRLVEEEEQRARRKGGGAARFVWVEVARTPLHVLAAFGRTTFDSPAFYDCRFVGGRRSEWICMTGVHYTIGMKSRAEYWPPVLYNVHLNEWHLLPAHSHNFLCIFPFEPRFHASL